MTTDVQKQLVEALSTAEDILAYYPFESSLHMSGLCGMWRHVLQSAPRSICITAARQVSLYFHPKAEPNVGYELQMHLGELAAQICQWRRLGTPHERYHYPVPADIDTAGLHEQLGETLMEVEQLCAGEKDSQDSYFVPCREFCSMWRYVLHTASIAYQAAAAREIVMYFNYRLKNGIVPDLRSRLDTLAREIAALYPVPIPQP